MKRVRRYLDGDVGLRDDVGVEHRINITAVESVWKKRRGSSRRERSVRSLKKYRTASERKGYRTMYLWYFFPPVSMGTIYPLLSGPRPASPMTVTLAVSLAVVTTFGGLYYLFKRYSLPSMKSLLLCRWAVSEGICPGCLHEPLEMMGDGTSACESCKAVWRLPVDMKVG